jgi:hypothetical protein
MEPSAVQVVMAAVHAPLAPLVQPSPPPSPAPPSSQPLLFSQKTKSQLDAAAYLAVMESEGLRAAAEQEAADTKAAAEREREIAEATAAERAILQQQAEDAHAFQLERERVEAASAEYVMCSVYLRLDLVLENAIGSHASGMQASTRAIQIT